MADYIASSDVATFLNITLQTAGTNILGQIIPALCALADTYCNRSWNHGSNDEITETFDGGTDSFMVANPPIASVVSITDGGEAVDVGDIYTYDSYVKLGYIPSPDKRSIVIKYKSSAIACPAPVKLALIQWAAQIFKAQNEGGKVVSNVTTGPVTMQYMTAADIPPFVRLVLDKYRLIDL